MKILYYANLHLTHYDGPSKHVLAVCQELAQRGHRVVLLSHPFPKSLRKHLSNVKAVQVPEFPSQLKRFRRWNRLLWKVMANWTTSLFHPEVIYQRDRAEDMIPLTIAQQAHIPLVIEVNGWLPGDAYRRDGLQGQMRMIDKLHARYSLAAALITSSPGLRDLLINTFELPSDRVIYIPNGVDLTRFQCVQPYHAPQGRFPIVGMVCGYHPLIDRETVIRSLTLLKQQGFVPSLRMLLYGEERHFIELQNLINDLRISSYVTLKYNVPEVFVPCELEKIDIAIVAYKRERILLEKTAEGLKLWEYWAAQRPVIATDVSGSDSFHHHEHKRYLAIEPENPKAMADAIILLWQRPILAEELARNGYQYVHNGHSWSNTAYEIEKVLYKVIGRQ